MSARGYRFHPAARQELDAASERYDEENAGLGLELLAEVADAIRLIVERPLAWQKAEVTVATRDVRRFVLRRFPFSIVYYVFDDVVRIVAVAHERRKPRYWRARARRDD